MADVTISDLSKLSAGNNALVPISQQGVTYAAAASSFPGLLSPRLMNWFYGYNTDLISGAFGVSIASPGWKNVTNVSNIVYSGVSPFFSGTPSGLVSFNMQGYITSGPYWWIWRLFNETTQQPCEIYKTPSPNSSTVVRYRTPVHGWSQQYPATFIVTPGHSISLQVAGTQNPTDSSPGPAGQSQTIYVATVEMYDGMILF